MASDSILLGQFLSGRKPDTADDPFTPDKAFIDVVRPPLNLSRPANLPPEPVPTLSTPAVLPIEPPPTLSIPAVIPPEPAPRLSVPAVLPPEPAPDLSIPAILPPEPAPRLSTPAVLPIEPPPRLSVPSDLPVEAAPKLSVPAVLPVETIPRLSVPAKLPAEPLPNLSIPSDVPKQPNPTLSVPATLPDQLVHVDPIIAGFFSVIDEVSQLSPLDAVLADDVRSIAAMGATLSKLLLLNRYGSNTPYTQNAFMTVGSLVDDIIAGTNSIGVLQDDPHASTGLRRVAVATGGTIAPGTFNGVPGPVGVVNLFTGDPVHLATPSQWDPIPGQAALGRPLGFNKLESAAFPNGLIPAGFKGENKGFFTFTRGAVDPPISDDEAYVPLAITDLRPVGQTYRTVYFRPLNVKLAESFSPSWNKAQYMGRVDPVATYQATGRTLNLSFLMAAFGPEDIQVIYNKLFWLQSMVYPEYDSDLQYYSGPIVRLRVGDVIDGLGPEGGRGLPGIIDSLEFDYGDSVWEIKKNLKVPRNIEVTIGFQVLHDMPIGRGAEGKFGGIGSFDGNGKYLPPGQSPGNNAATSPGSNQNVQLPDVSYGATVVRPIADPANSYQTLGGTNGGAGNPGNSGT